MKHSIQAPIDHDLSQFLQPIRVMSDLAHLLCQVLLSSRLNWRLIEMSSSWWSYYGVCTKS